MRSFLKQLEADGRGLVERTYWTKVLSGWAALSEEMRDVVMRRWLEARFDPKSARHYCGEIRRSIRGVRIFGALQWVLVVVVLPLMIKGPYYARDEFGLGFLMLFLFVFVLPGLLGLHVCQCVLAIDAFGKIHSFPMSKWERFRLAISPLHAMRASGYLMLTAGVVFDEMAWLLAVDAADDAMELARERQRTNEFGGGMPSSVLASWSAELRQMNERILNKAGVRSEDLALADGNTPKLSQYCPKCRGLFAGSMQTCAECGVPLKHLSKRQVLDVRNVITRISRRTKRD